MKKTFLPIIAASLAFFPASLWLYSRHLDFPYYYHADEPLKTKQVILDVRNFHHPLLLVDTVGTVTRMLGVPLQPQPVVMVGRWASVVFSALAVVFLVFFAGQSRGLAAAWCAGLFLFLHQDVLELAHYFKEDPALLCGVALTFLALILWARSKGGRGMALLLGAAAAVAFSAKYVGIVMLPLTLFFAWRRSQWRGALICLGGFVLVAALINHKMFGQWSLATGSLGKETSLITHGQKEVAKSIPNAAMLKRYLLRLVPPFGLFYVWGLVVWRRSREGMKGQALERAVETVMVFFPLAFTVLLSFSAKTSGRYFHPALLGMCYTAGLGLMDILHRCLTLTRRDRTGTEGQICGRALAAAVLGIAIVGSGWRAFGADQGFANDARSRLSGFIREKLPPSAVVMQGRRVELPDPRGGRRLDTADFPPLPQKLIDADWIADAGSLEALREQGVTHVAIAEDEYGRYMEEGAKAKKGKEAVFDQRRKFYQELFGRGKILLDIESAKIGTHNPPLRLVELPSAPKP
ncbi:MAG: phospholipid carrier-dependent glycosyltransferase [Verrucomicrobiaceae bacterium]|nr:MAG: phospholipid carrier-dependent glycosyltransferase [Verrucomicrobiaceae bacterium]